MNFNEYVNIQLNSLNSHTSKNNTIQEVLNMNLNLIKINKI